MSTDLYYTAPSDEVFKEIKKACIEIWQIYDNQFGYVDEKLRIIEPLENFRDNWMAMISMFDGVNRQRLYNLVDPETAELIREALQ